MCIPLDIRYGKWYKYLIPSGREGRCLEIQGTADMCRVKKADGSDISAIQGLDRMVLGDSSRKDYLESAVKAGQCHIVRIRDTVAGFGILEQSFYRNGFIALLIVHPDFRRQGVASAIIRYMESICPTKKLFTSTNESNIAAQKTYESLGFTRSGYVENLDEGDPEIIYYKQIISGGD